ncbi:lysophospholipid acyltransferase, partial [Chytridiales sp. JEL 0842]
MPITIFILNMLPLGVLCFYLQIISTETADVSAPVMVMTIKLSTIAWSSYDGSRPVEKLSHGQQQRAIKELPSFIEFLGYAFFFASVSIGPAFEFADYRRFTRREAPFDKMPSAGMPAAKTLFLGLVCMSIYFRFGSVWSLSFLTTKGIMEYSLLFRMWYVYVGGLIMRCKYYGAWKIAESSCILAGVGYAGVDEKGDHRWNLCENVNISKIELAQSPRDYIGFWNIKTNQWLRNCIYLRLQETQSNRTIANFCTYTTSAVWHGFNPSYYLTFLSAAILTNGSQSARRAFRPLFLGKSAWRRFKPLYDFSGFLLTQFICSYICAPFPLFTVVNGLRAWSSVYFTGHILMLIPIVLFDFHVMGMYPKLRKFGSRIGAEYEVRTHKRKQSGVTPT